MLAVSDPMIRCKIACKLTWFVLFRSAYYPRSSQSEAAYKVDKYLWVSKRSSTYHISQNARDIVRKEEDHMLSEE